LSEEFEEVVLCCQHSGFHSHFHIFPQCTTLLKLELCPQNTERTSSQHSSILDESQRHTTVWSHHNVSMDILGLQNISFPSHLLQNIVVYSFGKTQIRIF